MKERLREIYLFFIFDVFGSIFARLSSVGGKIGSWAGGVLARIDRRAFLETYLCKRRSFSLEACRGDLRKWIDGYKPVARELSFEELKRAADKIENGYIKTSEPFTMLGQRDGDNYQEIRIDAGLRVEYAIWVDGENQQIIICPKIDTDSDNFEIMDDSYDEARYSCDVDGETHYFIEDTLLEALDINTTHLPLPKPIVCILVPAFLNEDSTEKRYFFFKDDGSLVDYLWVLKKITLRDYTSF